MNNRFENKLCPICRARFTDKADIVVCPICGTPHHRACYEIRGHCGLENLHASGFTWNGRLPDEPEPVQTQPQNGFTDNSSAEQSDMNGEEGDNIFVEIGGSDDPFSGFFNKLRDPSIGEDGVSMKELTAYTATSAFHYGRAFDVFRSKSGGKKRRVFFNFASGFLAPAFQFYRKMDVFGLISMLIMLLPFGFAAFFPSFFSTSGAYYLLNVYSLATFIVLSAFGDYFYYLHAVKSIKKFRSSFKGDTLSDEYFEALAEKGKPSVLRAIVGILLFMLITSSILWLSGSFTNPSDLLGIFA